ncbi:MAG: translocation/assembly module TamB domain-containing protein [Phormidium sp. BM_Day4_Bin.17]|nr:translocation/assembly module TamB domain-containing protein [Phormidium sp. BM_Day4_Bin.17]UCJ11177.1 MAG: translocation/assembly module TamB domain-containing protein [Phormidium sp. PBR-2020]
MVNPSPQPEPNSSSGQHRRLKRRLILGGTLLVVTVVGYRVSFNWLRSQLPGWVEAQVVPILNRPLELGPVQRLSLTGIELGGLYLPPSEGNPNSLQVEQIQVGYDVLALLRGELPIHVTLREPRLIAQQAEDGTWVTLDLNLPEPTDEELPLEIPLNLILEGGSLELTPQGHSDPWELGFEGRTELSQSFENAYYDLAVTLPQGTVHLRGNTRVNSLETRVNTRLQEVELGQFLALLPPELGDRLDLVSGRLNGNLNLEVPPLITPEGEFEIQIPQIQGPLSLDNLVVRVRELRQPLTAEADLRFQGDRLQLDGLTAATGTVGAKNFSPLLQGQGQLSQDSGYNLSFSTDSIAIERLSILLSDPLLTPIDTIGLIGDIQGQAQLLGDLNDPQLTVSVSNTTPLIVAQTIISQLRVNLSANLDRVVLNDFRLSPGVGGSVLARGNAEISQWTAPLLEQLPEGLLEDRPQRTPRANLNLDVRVDLPSDALVAPYLDLPIPLRLGQLLAQIDLGGTLDNPQATLTWTTPDLFVPQLGAVSSQGEASFANGRLRLQRADLIAAEGQITATGLADFLEQTWQADLLSTPLNLAPFLAVPAELSQFTAQVSGRFDDLSPEGILRGIEGTADLGITLADGQAQVQGLLQGGEIRLEAIASGLSAQGLNLALPLGVRLERGRAQVQTSLEGLLAAAMNRDFAGIAVQAEGALAVAEGTAQVRTQVRDGQVDSNFNVANIALTPYLPNLPATVALMNAEGQGTLSLANILQVLEQGDLSQLDPQGTTQANLALNQGSGSLSAQVAGGQWQLRTETQLPVDDALVEELIGDRIVTSPRFPAILQASSHLSGSLTPLLQLGTVPIPATLHQLTANLDGDLLRARGETVLTNLRQRPDLQMDLEIDANYDSDRLPLTLLLADVAVGENLQSPSAVNVRGRVDFRGRFQGQNLLSNPFGVGNLNLAGAVQLNDFGVNEIQFEPRMRGTVFASTGDRLALDLRGEQPLGDRLAIALGACQEARCLAPYLPQEFEIRKTDGEVVEFLARGERQGDRVQVGLDSFELSLLNVLPGEPFGIDDPISGQVTGGIVANLFTLETQGQVAVANPALGYLRGEAIAAEFGYDGQQAQIRNGRLQFQETRLVLNGGTELDLLAILQGRLPLNAWQEAPVWGRLTVDEAEVGDLLTTVAWYELDDLLRRGIASPSLDPQDLTVTGVGIPQRSLPEQLALFNRIRQQVRQRISQPDDPQPPQVVEIEGTYTAQVDLGGTLGNPNLIAELTAENWRWYPQPQPPAAFRAAIPTPRPSLRLDALNLRARLEDQVLTVEEASLLAEGGQASLVGTVSPERLEGGVTVRDFPVSLVQRFVDVPVDVAGEVNLQGTFGGSLQQPRLVGEVAIANPVLNNRPLDPFLGNFSYDNQQFEFATLAPDWSRLQVSVPFPFTDLPPEGAIARAQVALDTPAFELIEAISEGEVVWLGGEGLVELSASVDLLALTSGEIQRILNSVVAQGAIALDQSRVAAAALPEAETQVDGVIRFNQEAIVVDELLAQVAEGEFRLGGVLPLLTPDPELERPLTLTVDQGAIALDGLYNGQLDGRITLTGTALTPVISGGIEVSRGRVLVPTRELTGGELATAINPTVSPQNPSPLITPVLDRFRIVLGERLNIVNPIPSFNVRVRGDLLVSGVVDGNLENLRPQGVISVERGQLDLLSNLFFITPGRPQTVEFIAEEGLLNPRLDLQMSTLVSEERRNPIADRDRDSNEVPDTTILPLRQSRQLLVNVTIDAMAQDLLNAVLAESPELVQVEGFQRNDALLETVQLSSVPSRSENELVSLLGGQVLTTIDEIAGLRGTELFEYALLRFVLEPQLTGLLVDVDRVANQAGDAIGLDRLSVFPIGQVEAIYELNERSLLGLTYDYGLSGFLLQGGQTDGETPGFSSIELRYELRF